MGTSKQTIQINAEIKASLSGMDEVVSELEEGLKKQKYDLSKNSGLAKLIKQYKNAKSEFDSLTELDKVGLGDVDKTAKAAQKVANIYKRIGQSFRKIQAGNIDTFKNLFPDNFSAKIEKGNKAINQYFKKLEEKSAKESRAQILERDLERLNTTLSTLENKRIKAEVEVDISKAQEKLKKLQEERKNFLEDFSKSITPKEVKDSSGKIYDKAIIQAQIEAAEKEVEDKEKKVKNLEKRKLSQQELDEIDQLKEGYEGVDFKRQQKAAQDALKKYRDEASARDLAQNEGIVDKGRSRRTFGNLTDEELEDRIREKQQELIKLEKKEKQYKDKIAEIRARPEQEFKQQKKQADAEVSTAKTKLENANKDLETYQKLKAAQEEVIKQKTADFESGKDNTGVRQEDIDKLKQYDDAIQEVTRSIKELNEEKTYSNQAEKDDATSKKKSEIDKKKLELQTLQNSIKELTEATNIDEVFKKLEELNLPLKDIEHSSEGLQKLKKELKELDSNTVEDIRQNLKQLGFTAEETEDIIRQLDNGLDKLDLEKVNITKKEQDMENLKNQVLDFFSITNTIQIFKNVVRDAFNTVKELDAAMTETAVVTDFSVGDMWDKLPQYSEEATKLGASIKSLYEATTLYYQQGLNSEQAMGVGIETMKMARIANMDAAAATKAMTAALRGFNMEINEMSATRINDVYSELAAITAADTSQIATAMSKTASIASSANMEFETTAALLAQIIETTQEAPETAGTAMKTIIARFTEVKQLFSEGMLTGEDSEGEEININKIDAALKTVGISLKDFLNGTKGIDDIFLELASKWDTLDLATQRYIATTAAGSRQQSRFLAMMGNYDRTMELVTAANDSAGASAQQFDKTLESLDAKSQRLKNAWAEFTMGLANNKIIKFGVDLLTVFITVINKITEALPGATGNIAKLLLTIGGLKAGGAIFDSFFQNLKKVGPEAMGPFQALAKSISSNFSSLKTNIGGLFNSIKAMGGLGGTIKTLGSAFFSLDGGIRAANMAQLGFNTTLAASPIGWIVIAIAAAIAAIYGLVKAWQAASDAFKLNAINDSINQMTSNIEGAKQAIEDLKDSKSSLKVLQKEFSDLTKGTQEWKEKLIETNQQVLDLLEKYPELSAYITRTDFGSLDIEDAGWDALLAAQENTLKNTTNAKIGMQYMRSDLQEKMDYEELLTSAIGSNFGETIDTASLGANIGTALGTVIGGTGLGLFGSLAGPGGTIAGITAGGTWGAATGNNLGYQWGQENQKAIQKVFADVAEWGSQAILDVAGFLDTGWGKVAATALNGLGGVGINIIDTLNGEDTLEDTAQRAMGAGFTQNEISEILMALADAGITYDGESFSADQATIQSVLEGLEFEASFEQLTALADKLGTSFSELTVSAQKYSLAKEGQRDGLMASAISNSSIANKVYAEAVGNILGETVYENIEPMLNEKESGLQDKSKKELKKLYAEEVGGFYENGKLYSDATMATEWDLSKDTMKAAISSAQVAKDMGKSAEDMGKILDDLSADERQMFSELFSSDGTRISDQTYIDLLRDGSKASVDGAVTGDWLAQQMGFESMSVMAEKLGISVAEVGEILATNLNAARTRITNARKATVGSMKKYGNQADSYDKHAQDLARMEETYGPEFNDYLTNLFDKVTRANDDALTSGVFSEFMEIAKSGDSSLLAEANSLINDIDWSNPIQAVSELQKKVETGTKEVQEMASAILKAGENAFSSGKQMQYFVQSESFEGVRESIQDIIETEGEISASNILEMADECSDLKKILDQTKVSSAGLAKALTGLETGELTVNQLTDAVMASLKSFNSLDSLVAEISKTLEDFDLGVDENIISDTISSWYDVIKENMEKGAVGNSQIDSIMDFMLGKNWDKNPVDGSFYSEDVTYGQMEMMNNWLKNNSEDTYYSWKQMAEGKDFHGDKLGDLGGLTIGKNADGSIALNGFEGMTSEEVAQRIAAAYGVTDEAGKMLLTDFKNYSLNLARELNANDFETAFKDSLGELNTITQINSHNEDMTRIGGNTKKVIDESEIRAIAEMYGQNFDEVLQRYKDEKVQITDFYDDDGNLLSGDKLIAELDRVFTPETGRENGTNWYAGFTKKVNGKTIIDYDGMMEQLGKLNLPESAKVAMTADIVESIRQGTAEGGSVFIDYEFSDGKVRPIEIPAGIDVATAIANAEQDLKNEKLGEAIAAAFGNVEVSVSTDEGNLNTEVTLKIETAVKAADTTVAPKVSSDSTSQITSDVAGAIRSGSTSATASVYANTAPLEDEVANLELTVYANVVASGEVAGGGDGSDGTGPKPAVKQAEGVKNSSISKIAFIAEEGPEIHQTADGAYLASTPQFAKVEKGDTIYTAEETKKILKASSTKVPRYADGFRPGWGYGGSGGASASKDDEDVWENPYDKLYNLVRKIDEELRQRERIERRYEKLLQGINSSANKIIQISREELAQLEKERMLQEQLVSGRRSQIEQYQRENSDLMRYANVVQNDRGEDVLRINWDLINSVTDSDQGQRIEDYVNQLEEWFDELTQAEDALWDIEDAVAEIKERGKEEYFNLEDKIKEALTQAYQSEIDKLNEINTSINDTNSSLVDAIQKSINKSRQDRENQRTEDELSEKQRRLLYLQQDTSGANAMEILKLQKEIAEGQEDYTDTLIDQKISELQDQNEQAAQQREQQITIAQAQLDHYIETGRIWQEVYGLMDEGLDHENGLVRGSRLEAILKSTEGFKGMSEIAKMEWLNDTNNMIAQALAYLEIGRQLEDIGVSAGTEIEFTTADGRVLTGTVDDKGNVTTADGQVFNNVFQGADGKYYAGENIADVEEPEVESPSSGQGGSNTQKKDNPYGVASNQGNYTARNGTMWSSGVKAIQWALNDMGYNAGTVDGGYGYATAQAVSRFQRAEGISADGDYGPQTREKMKLRGYKTGGLADFTGPAWLDGTKAHPELVLNQRDTQNFIQLKDILASLMSGGSHTSTENNGDITYDIDINVESIGSDYDVEQVANKVRSLINSDARYRNNNAVSLMR